MKRQTDEGQEGNLLSPLTPRYVTANRSNRHRVHPNAYANEATCNTHEDEVRFLHDPHHPRP